MSRILGDREFFNEHPDHDIRRRPVVPGEVPRSLADRDIREVEARKVSSDILLLRFIDVDGGWTPMLPVFEPDTFLTPEGRREIVSCLNMMDSFSSFAASRCARYESEAE
jgi:hypothetical protein